MTVKALNRSGGSWGFLGLMISAVAQPKYVDTADDTYTLRMQPTDVGATTFHFQVTRTYLDGGGNYILYQSSAPITFAGPYTNTISRVGDHYEFRSNGTLLYTTTGTGADFYTPAAKNAMVYYEIVMAGDAAMTATVDDFGIAAGGYTLAYAANGGTGTDPSSSSVSAGASVTTAANPYTRTGYTFTGWNTAADGSGTAATAGGSFTMPAANTTLYAQWNTPYNVWATTNAPTGTAADDFDGDGVSNGVEYILGGDKNTNDLGKMPKTSTDGGDMLFTFERSQASIDGSTTVVIEVSTDLATWNTSPSPYAVPDVAAINNPGVSVVKDSPVAGMDTVTLRLPRAPDNRKFARLVVIVP